MMKTIWMAVVFVVALGVLSGLAVAQGDGCLDAVCLELDGYRTTTWQAVAPQRGRSLEVVPAGPIQTSDWALSVNGELVHPSPGNGRLQFDNLPRPVDSLDGEAWVDAVRWSAYGRTYMYLVYKGSHRLALPSISDALVRSTSRSSRSGGSRSSTTPSGGNPQPAPSAGSCSGRSKSTCDGLCYWVDNTWGGGKAYCTGGN